MVRVCTGLFALSAALAAPACGPTPAAKHPLPRYLEVRNQRAQVAVVPWGRGPHVRVSCGVDRAVRLVNPPSLPWHLSVEDVKTGHVVGSRQVAGLGQYVEVSVSSRGVSVRL